MFRIRNKKIHISELFLAFYQLWSLSTTLLNNIYYMPQAQESSYILGDMDLLLTLILPKFFVLKIVSAVMSAAYIQVHFRQD